MISSDESIDRVYWRNLYILMCITFFILRPTSGHTQNIEFVIGFNRDEQTQRKTIPFSSFEEDPNIFAGKDLLSGGTWLGINQETGILAFLTNYDLDYHRLGKSRGKMIKKFLKTDFLTESNNREHARQKITSEMLDILKQSQTYAAFNLVVYHIKSSQIFYICTEIDMKQPLMLSDDTFYGLCNTDIFNIWPKTEHGLKIFRQIISKIEDKPSTQILKELEFLMEDKKSFSEDPQNEASIYVQPYYSKLQKAERMTKSSFLGIIRKEANEIKFEIKEITYDSKIKKEVVQMELIL